MHRFGEKVEFRVDQRHLFLFFLAAVIWTLLTFFLGMIVAGEGKSRPAERALSKLGWLDQHKPKPIRFTFGQEANPRSAQAQKRGKQPQQDASPMKPRLAVIKAHNDEHRASHEAQPKRNKARKAQRPSRRYVQAPLQKRQAPPKGRSAAHDQRLMQRQARKLLQQRAKQKALAAKRKLALERKRRKRLAAKQKAEQRKKDKLQRRPNERMVPWNRARYTIRLRLLRQRSSALKLRRKLAAKGYRTVEVIAIRKPGAGRLYRVSMGYFPTRSTATRFLRRFRQRERISGRVITFRR